jgi:AbrB family looped-hinge helix DNA binding protein
MPTVVLSSKYEIVIPKNIREEAGGCPGQKFEVFRMGDVIEIVPVRDIRAARGCLPGLKTEVEREEHDRV